jgi:thiosulfate/3-mercaptopyruvate sulfurtransferase
MIPERHRELTGAGPVDHEDSFPPLVDVDWLKQRIGEPDIVVLDATYPFPQIDDPHRVFRAIHLPTARFLDFGRVSRISAPLPRLVPSSQPLLSTLLSLGIDQDTHVIFYDQHGLTFGASRAWWLLRLFGHHRSSVLDGGLTAWLNAGFSCAQGEPEVPDVKAPGTWRLVRRRSMVISRPQVEHALRAGTAAVVDVRPEAYYRGEAPELLSDVAPGHIPGSINLPFPDLLDGPSARLLPPSGITARLEAAGVPSTLPVIATCSIGVIGCTLALALQTIGRRWSMHDEGWADWQRGHASAA